MRQIFISLLALTSVCASAQETLSLSLAECRQMALAASEDLQMRQNDIDKSDCDYDIARTGVLPGIDASATGLYMTDQDLGGTGKMLLHGAYSAGVTLTQPIYVGGKIAAGKRLADMGRQASLLQQKMARMDVIAETDNAYWTYLAVLRKVDMVATYEANLDSLARMTAKAVEVGMATENDLLTIRTHQSNLRYQKQRTLSGADLCRMALCRLLGVDMATSIVLSDSVINVSAPTAADADISERPEVALLDVQIEVANQQKRLNTAQNRPVVALSLGYNVYGNLKMQGTTVLEDGTPYDYEQEYSGGVGMAMLTAQIPIWHWGQTTKTRKKYDLDIRNAELVKQKNERLLALQAEQALRNMTDSYLLVGSAEDAQRQAQENLRVVTNRYRASLCPLSDLLDAEGQWKEAVSNYIEAQGQYMIYQTEWLRATGRLE